jgi:hypothetical protein
MRHSSSTAKWILSLGLTVALAFAPAATAFAECMPGKAQSHASMAHGQKAPCDTPCSHCEGDDEQQPCQGHCAGVMVSITPSTAAFAPQTLPARALALCTNSPLAFARPPDTPPPRSFPV